VEILLLGMSLSFAVRHSTVSVLRSDSKALGSQQLLLEGHMNV